MGKWHEGQTRRYFEGQLKPQFVERFTDSVYMQHGRMMSAASPPDLIVLGCNDKQHYLVESKAKHGVSIPFDRLIPHQHSKLVDFDYIGDTFHGIVSLLYYKEGWDKWKRMFLVPILEWETWKETLGRKSLPMKVVADSSECTELVWVPGDGWRNE